MLKWDGPAIAVDNGTLGKRRQQTWTGFIAVRLNLPILSRNMNCNRLSRRRPGSRTNRYYRVTVLQSEAGQPPAKMGFN